MTLAAATLSLAGCGQPNAYVPPPPAAVAVAHPVERQIVQQLEFTGATRSAEAVDIRARVTGYLQQVAFQDGAHVQQGDLLFVIEPGPFEVARDSAKAAEQRAAAALTLAEGDLQRTEPLVQRGALTAQELDLKRANMATAQADVASARAAIRQAELDLAYTQIKAPISGRVSRHLVDVGNLVQPGDTVLTRVESTDPIHVYFSVSEADVLQFMKTAAGDDGSTTPENRPTLYLGLTGEEGFPHEGRLDFVELGVDPLTGTQMRRGSFPNVDGKLVPGLFVRVRLPIGNPQPGLMIPNRAIATDQRGEYVLTVNDKNVVEHRPVALGMRVGDMRVVTSGVQAGDWIVVNGLQRARPGAEVKPEQLPSLPETDSLLGANDPALPRGGAPQTDALPPLDRRGGRR